MKKYGIPYMGSKQKIIPSLALNFPKAENFYDLFGGGFSVSHYMLENFGHKFKHVFYNEIKSDIVELVKDAIAGKYSYDIFKPEFIDRETFEREKENNAYMRVCWSFGNNQKGYLFSKDIEPYKKSMHNAVVFDQFDDLAAEVLRFKKWPSNVNAIKEKRFYLIQLIYFYGKTKIPKCLHKYLNAKQLQQLQRTKATRETTATRATRATRATTAATATRAAKLFKQKL